MQKYYNTTVSTRIQKKLLIIPEILLDYLLNFNLQFIMDQYIFSLVHA